MHIKRLKSIATFAILTTLATQSANAWSPGTLKTRPETNAVHATGGSYSAPFPGSLSGTWLEYYGNQYVLLQGTGYFSIRWEIAWFNNGTGVLTMPTIQNTGGTLIHVASGGGHRGDDVNPDPNAQPGQTWMGDTARGYDTVPAGAAIPWQMEYYYLNGSAMVEDNEGWIDYNLGISPTTRATIQADVNKGPGAANSGYVRYGAVYDKA